MKRVIVILILFSVFLTGCGNENETTPTLSGPDIAFTQVQMTVQAALTEPVPTNQPTEPSQPTEIPPTEIVETVTIEPTVVDTQPGSPTTMPEPTQNQNTPCLQAGFVEDRTILDGTQMLPGQVFTKTWRLINLGSCVWTPDFRVIFNSGNAMGAEPALAFTAIDIPVGAVVDVSIEMTAPAEAGKYQGYWLLRSGGGEIFGTVPSSTAFYVDIEVVAITSTPTETQVPSITPTPTITNTPEPDPTDE